MLLSLLSLLPSTAFAQTFNDFCTDAITIDVNETIPGSTSTATFDGVATCGTSNTAPGVWYRVLPTEPGELTLSTCSNATYDTKISVYRGSCDTLTCVGGDDDTAGCLNLTSEVVVDVIPGETYLVLVHGFDSNTGDFQLSSSFDSDSTNETCDQPIVVGAPESVVGDTTSALADVAPLCGTGDGTGGGLWYSYTAPADGTFTASTCNATTDFDTKLRIYSDSCSGLVCEDGSDDDTTCPFDTLQSTVSIPVSEGATYSILVHGFGGAEGTFQLDTDLVATIDPVGDMALWANAAYGSEVVTEASSSVRLRPSRWQTQLNNSTAALADGGCTTSTVPQDWAGGAFDVRTKLLDGTHTQGAVSGSLPSSETFVATIGGANAGGSFSAIAGGKGVADLGPGDFVAGYWVRTSGRRGVFHAVTGTCDDAGTAPDALSSWFRGSLSGWP